ncbi:hypothetical protein V1520DRAFT_274601, partial [Lipomyces starkeyi]
YLVTFVYILLWRISWRVALTILIRAFLAVCGVFKVSLARAGRLWVDCDE